MKPVSIKSRILAWLLPFQLILAVAACTALLAYVRKQQVKAFDAELDARLESLIADIEPSNGKLEVQEQDSIPPNHLFIVLDAKGKTIANRGLDGFVLAPDGQKIFPLVHDGKQYRAMQLRSFELQGEEGIKIPPHLDLLYAMPADGLESRFHKVVITAVIIGVLFLLLTALVTWWAVARGLQPLNELAERAAAIDANHWLFEVPRNASATSELLPLGNALLQLTQRLKAAFDRERRFFSDASHELKTSVAIQKSSLQLLEQGSLSLDEYKLGVARALEDTGRAEKLVANMLRLDAAESGKLVERTSTLADSLDFAIGEMRAMAENLQVNLTLNGSTGVDVCGDAIELSVVFSNVLENALQHSPARQGVLIQVRPRLNGLVEVSIADSGAGISAEDLPHVFERFYRADHSRTRGTGGFGLGLAIARSLIERNQGCIDIQSSPGNGTCVVIGLKAVIQERTRH